MFDYHRFAIGCAISAAVGIVLLALTGCGHKGISSNDTVAPAKPDPRICAAIEQEPGVKGGLVQPVTDEEKFQFEEFLSGEWAAREFGRRGWKRASIAKDQFCRE